MKLTRKDIDNFRKATINYFENEVIIKKGRNQYSVYVFTKKQAEDRLNLAYQLTDEELKERILIILKKLDFTYKDFKEIYK